MATRRPTGTPGPTGAVSARWGGPGGETSGTAGTGTPTPQPPRAVVFTPSPRLTVTIEPGPRHDEIHIHAGGQGVWQARMLVQLGLRTALHAPFAGEVGAVLRGLLSDGSVEVHGLSIPGTNGAYVHDRRNGTRQPVAEMGAIPLDRHQVDDLYGALLADALDADICLLAGPDEPGVVPRGLYRRLAADVATTGVPIVVDLSGDTLDEVLDVGATAVKVSDEELVADGRAPTGDVEDVIGAMEVMHRAGAGTVVVTRAAEPTLALVEGELWLVDAPVFTPVEPAGGGDSFVAAFAATLARTGDTLQALHTGAAAGALNVTRRGLASGDRQAIERLAAEVKLHRYTDPARSGGSLAP